MKIIVPIKRVPDPYARVRLRPDGTGLETEGLKYALNPFDAIALEEALRLKDRWPEISIVAVTIGDEACTEQLLSALAMGADRAVLVLQAGPLDSLAVAKGLAGVYAREIPGLVLMGKQATDDDSNQAGQMLAGLLGLPQATFVSKLELRENRTGFRCHRETDAGLECIEVGLPAVVTADLRLNEPRYISLPSIIRAKKKPIERITPVALGVDLATRTTLLGLETPVGRKAGVRVQSVDDLVNRLRQAAVLA